MMEVPPDILMLLSILIMTLGQPEMHSAVDSGSGKVVRHAGCIANNLAHRKNSNMPVSDELIRSAIYVICLLNRQPKQTTLVHVKER